MRVAPTVALASLLCVAPLLGVSPAAAESPEEGQEEGWVSLFNGKDMSGWKVNQNPETFSVKDGVMIVKGPIAHAFYAGDVGEADFKDFEWKCEIMTKPQANSGMYFHTKYQDEGWLKNGYEVQVNQTHADPRKTGGLYGVKDVMDKSPVKDNEWFTQQVTVKGKHVVVRVNGKVTCDYTESDDHQVTAERGGRKISHGTVAIQGHDPGSEVHYRKIMIKPLK